MILLNHPTGNTFSRALLKGLLEAGELGLFATSISVREQDAWLKLLPGKVRAELLRRQFDAPREKIFTRPRLETLRLVAGRMGWSFLDRHETGLASFDAVYKDLDHALAKRLPRLAKQHRLTGVYAYEMGAVRLFRAARELGLKRYYDLPIAYWETSRRLLAEETARWPQWAPTLLGARDSEAKLRDKVEETELADVIFCPSEFVRQTIPENLRAGRRCVIAEFGSPERATPPEFRPPGAKLRILFAGSMTQRKGLADVFAAMKLLNRKDVELIVLGSPHGSLDFYRREYPGFAYEPPRPHAEVLRLMETCDALLLPSIVEGRALVQQEAMSSGLLLLATPNAGGQDLIDEGKTGFLLPIRSPEAIAEKLDWLADHRPQIAEMKRAAYDKAASVTWARYARKILRAIHETEQGGARAETGFAPAKALTH
jgi:glycosyltransferase involved in cell wall biosynthesis